jgi:predicted transposase/invertase (TIGR01784 family)
MDQDDGHGDESLDLSSSPHDAFFKSVFSDPEYAVGFLRRRLPPAISAAADWGSLQVLPGSFVKSSLSQVHSDLVFSLQIGERQCLLYLLLEHQSTVDPSMPLRLLGYVSEVLLRHHREHGLPLPPVIPFVFHQGPDAWTVSPDFEDLFDLPECARPELLDFLPKFRHALLDLSGFDPAAEEDDATMQVILQLMKFARSCEMLPFFRWFAGTETEQFPDALLMRLLVYALHADEDLDVEEIYRNLSSNPDLQHKTMSVAEKLKAEGRVEGLEKGLWTGKTQALEEFLGLPVSPRESLEALDIEAIEARCEKLRRDYEARFKGK